MSDCFQTSNILGAAFEYALVKPYSEGKDI